MDETQESPNLLVRREKPPKQVMWYEARGLKHPLSDPDFVDAFCEHIFCTTTDHSLRQVRARAYRFIRNFMAPELKRELLEYRKVYK